jgi:hypothetical protein
MLHQSLIVGLGFALASARLGPFAEPFVILLGTIAGCWAITAVVRRVRWLRPLFGLKSLPAPQSLPAASRAMVRDAG